MLSAVYFMSTHDSPNMHNIQLKRLLCPRPNSLVWKKINQINVELTFVYKKQLIKNSGIKV